MRVQRLLAHVLCGGEQKISSVGGRNGQTSKIHEMWGTVVVSLAMLHRAIITPTNGAPLRYQTRRL
jgi:hypothetical protein